MHILHVDDHVLVRSALRLLLTDWRGDLSVREAASYEEAMAALRALTFDLLLIDVELPGIDGITLVRDLRKLGIATPVLILSARRSEETIAEAMRMGADGYALKHGSPQELLAAMEALLAGRPTVAAGTPWPPRARASGSGPTPTVASLTRRERQVFDLLTAGRSARQIAGDLTIGLKTVETHRERLFKKLDVHSIVALMRFAARHQLLEFTA